ncbi:MAG TPA: radical SAM family heme chaperone HemW [Methylomirabilota bacterium]|jgi:oxygen-independent coproporphyrinogen-3 oxidase|nr:radical SAM family heme chaperone HemW [Methylomirabilota bacterium]
MVAGSVPRSSVLGFYLHVPFCVQRCHYCSFNTAPLADGQMDPYLAALHGELDLLGALDWAGDVTLATVFLGGGTPSLLEPDALAAVLDRLRRHWRLAPDAEITVECNPESVTRARLAGYRAAGVTRVSLGVQSLDDAILKTLGRLHDARRARAAFDAAREAGCDDVSVDVMYGLPGLAADTWARDLERVLDWAPDHVSAYALTLDGGSAWTPASVPNLPAEDEVVAQYWALARAATARGFEHYEVSNYARPGRRARHNLGYWRAAEYLAAGPGACGFVGDVRYGNIKPLARWTGAVAAGTLPVETAERLTPRQRSAERLILGLRMSDGVPAAWLAERAAGDPALARRIEDWREAGHLRQEGGTVRLTESGFLLSDALFVDLL